MQWRRRWRRLSDSPEKVEKAGKGNRKPPPPPKLTNINVAMLQCCNYIRPVIYKAGIPIIAQLLPRQQAAKVQQSLGNVIPTGQYNASMFCIVLYCTTVQYNTINTL
jgi:hypothetical protein